MASPSSRCGFTLDESDVDADRTSGECQRPICKDTNRCVWHAKSDEKSFSDLEDTLPLEDPCLDGARLSDIDFDRGIDFADCRFVGAHFENVDVADSNFEGATFDEADLFEVDFSDASSLAGTTFRNVELFDVHFEERDLSDSNFQNATCEVVYFDGATLTDAEFECDDLELSDTRFLDARLQRATFTDGQLHTVSFDGATLENATFRDTSLTDTTFNGSGTDLTNAGFEAVDLERGVEFAEARLSRAAFIDVTATNRVVFEEVHSGGGAPPHFENCEFPDATFQGVNLEDVRFEDVDLLDATFECANLDEVEFIECTLNGSDFSCRDGTTSLEAALFSTVDLRDVDFSDTKLYQTIFSDVRIDARTTFDPICVYERDVEPTIGDEDVDRYAAAAWVYRRLESLHESNALAETARQFHIRASEARRAHLGRQLFGSARRKSSLGEIWPQYIGSILNRCLTNHGESLGRVICWSILTIGGAAFLYPFVGGIIDGGEVYRFSLNGLLPNGGETLTQAISLQDAFETFLRSLYFSAITFTTIGYANAGPAGFGSRVLVVIESLLGGVFIALFVFVLGRHANR